MVDEEAATDVRWRRPLKPDTGMPLTYAAYRQLPT